MLTNIISGFIIIMIGISLVPVISEQVLKASNDSDMSPLSRDALKTLPIIFTIVVVFVGVAICVKSFRDVGLLGGTDMDYVDDSDETDYVEEKQEPQKQTYLDYVKERLAVEKLMRVKWRW